MRRFKSMRFSSGAWKRNGLTDESLAPPRTNACFSSVVWVVEGCGEGARVSPPPVGDVGSAMVILLVSRGEGRDAYGKPCSAVGECGVRHERAAGESIAPAV